MKIITNPTARGGVAVIEEKHERRNRKGFYLL